MLVRTKHYLINRNEKCMIKREVQIMQAILIQDLGQIQMEVVLILEEIILPKVKVLTQMLLINLKANFQVLIHKEEVLVAFKIFSEIYLVDVHHKVKI